MTEHDRAARACNDARRSLASLVGVLPEERWREHKGVFENAVEALVDTLAACRAEVEKWRRKHADLLDTFHASAHPKTRIGLLEKIGDLTIERDAARADAAAVRRALTLMMQAFDPDWPGACHQECFDTSDGHGYEMQEHAKTTARAVLDAAGRAPEEDR